MTTEKSLLEFDVPIQLGELVLASAVFNTAACDNKFQDEVQSALYKHMHGDWGERNDTKNKIINDIGAKYGDTQIVSMYHTSYGELWVLTAADRSKTTVSFPTRAAIPQMTA